MINILVTSVGAPPGRNSVRALLKHKDLEIFASDAQDEALRAFPYQVEKVCLPLAKDPSFLGAVKHFCIENKISVILPCLETEALVYSKNKKFFEEAGISIPVPDYSVLERGLDKTLLTKIAAEAGLPVPKSVTLIQKNDFQKISQLTYPIIAKPSIGYGARGVFIYEKQPNSWKDLEDLLLFGEIIVQEYIPGGAGSIHLCAFVFDQKHQIKVSYQSKSTKTKFDFGGPAIAGITVIEPKLREYGERLMTQIGNWVGPVNMEFKRHEKTGEFFILDLNPRIWGYSSLAEDAGLSFPYASILVAQNKSFRSHSAYLSGVKMERFAEEDRSEFSFCPNDLSAQTVKIDRFSKTAPSLVAICPAQAGEKFLDEILENPEVEMVLVPISPGEARLERNNPKLFQWNIPKTILTEDYAYWAGHLLSGHNVRYLKNSQWITQSFEEIREGFWGQANA